jgi:cobalt-zinc-cadmium efflux system outer membrane protein
MRTLPKVLRALAGLLLVWPLLVQAESNLSLDEAINLAARGQPLLQSFDEASRASQQAAIAAGQLPDPKLRLGIINLPITGSEAGRFNRDDMTMSTIGIMQEMVPESERKAAAQSMQAVAGQFQTEKAVTALTIKRDVALAWLEVFEAERRSELYRKIAEEMAAERKTLVSRISSGATASAEVLKLDAELAMANDKRLAAIREEKKARAALARWIGDAAHRPLGPELPVTDFQTTRTAAKDKIAQHPALLNAEQMEAVAQSEAELAKAARDLNWSWEVMYGKRRSDLSDMVGFQVAVELPWDRPNRQDRRIAEKQLLVERAQQLTQDRRQQLVAELESALAEAEIAEARQEEHIGKLVPAARARLELVQAAYRAGKDNLSEVWEARRALIEAEMHHWLVLTDRHRAAVKLDYLLANGPLIQGTQP